MNQHKRWWEIIGVVLSISLLIGVTRALLKAQPPTTDTPPAASATPEVGTSSPVTPTVAAPQITPTFAVAQATPTVAPQITPTQDAVTVGGYTFSYPQEVPDGRGPVDIVGWLPGSPNEIVDTRDNQVTTIDVYTGKIREFSPVFTTNIVPARVLLLPDDRVAFYTQFRQGADLWISGDGDEMATGPVFQEVGYSAILAPGGESLIVYNRATLATLVFGQREPAATQALERDMVRVLSALPLHHEPEEIEQGVAYRNTFNPVGRWTAFDHDELVILADLKTGETQQFALSDHQRTETLRWSPDGQQLALLVTEGQQGSILYQKLFILDSAAMELREIKTESRYVIDVTWAPDSQNLLIAADLGKTAQAPAGFDYKTDGLFLVSIASGQIHQAPILPENTALGFDWGVSWAPDGNKIALRARFALADMPHLYRIDVHKP